MANPPATRLDLGLGEPVPDALKGGSYAIGSFDGVHLGHQALLRTAERVGRPAKAPPIALTFEPHPRAVLQPDAPFFRLVSPSTRRLLLGLAGAKGVVEMAFNRDLAGLSPEAFVETVLVGHLEARAVVVGEGFRFGSRRAGDTDLLKSLGDEHGFDVEILAPVKDRDDQTVSSGRIRDALRGGEITNANELLGYRWFVIGEVAHGDKRGRELGFPTANIHPSPSIDLRHGVYAVSARWQNEDAVAGVASYGVRPMFGGVEPILEVHLFDSSVDLYGRELTTTFHDWIREEAKFDSTEALVRQMEVDSEQARRVLAAADASSPIDKALLGLT